MNHKAITPLLARVIAFFGAFVLLSGLLGPRIIGSDILYRDYFFVYGSLGKALLFAALAFMLLIRNQPAPAVSRWSPTLLSWAAACLAAFSGAWVSTSRLMAHGHNLAWIIAAHSCIIASIVMAWLACFGFVGSRLLARHYRRAGLYALGAGAGFYALLAAVYASWQFFASIVLHAVRLLLDISGITAEVILPHTLLLDKFGVTIAQTCSGIESIALFSGLYIVVGLIDRHRLNWWRFLPVFPLALGGLFIFNIIRVYLLILGGYYINPHIAFSLFHTYAGMIFFIIYALIFWKVSYRWMLRNV